MKWWQKKVRGWIVPFWFTDTPLFSKKFAQLNKKEISKLANEVKKRKDLN